MLKTNNLTTFGDTYSNGYKIPFKIHYTFKNHNLPNDILLTIRANKKLCKEFEFKFYNDEDVSKYISDNFADNIFKAYDSINPIYGAMRADFFRYCILYNEGGVYIDIKSQIHKSLIEVISKDDVCILDIPTVAYEPWRKHVRPTYEQWLLIFAPKHPYLHSMIELMTDYILTKYQPTIPGINKPNSKQMILNITGPDALSLAIEKYINKTSNILHRNVLYGTFAKRVASDYYNMYRVNGVKHYSEYTESLYK